MTMTPANRMARTVAPNHGGLGLGFFFGGGWYRTRFDFDLGMAASPIIPAWMPEPPAPRRCAAPWDRSADPTRDVIRLLRRFQPRNPVLAVGYWLVLGALAVAILFVVFFFLDSYINPLDQPSV